MMPIEYVELVHVWSYFFLVGNLCAALEVSICETPALPPFLLALHIKIFSFSHPLTIIMINFEDVEERDGAHQYGQARKTEMWNSIQASVYLGTCGHLLA